MTTSSGTLLAFLISRSTVADRLWIVFSAMIILASLWFTGSEPGEEVVIFRNAQRIEALPLDQPAKRSLPGRLGPVEIEIRDGAARLREFESARMIGTRTGWISATGEIAACVPCGIMIRISGGAPSTPTYDAVAR
ncbi:MAG: NusG domain II-containing protein [Magnetococcales bacterium]|nr:NusG domain II-containing protein [Magnetococcales bacterium]